MTDTKPGSRIALIAGLSIAGAALLGFGGYTLLSADNAAASKPATKGDLSTYNGVWVDDQGRWIHLIFSGEEGLLLSQGIEVRLQLTSRDQAAGADTFQARDSIVGSSSTAVFIAQDGQPRRLLRSTDGSTVALTYLKALTPAETAQLQTRLATKGTTMLEQLSPDVATTSPAPSANLTGTQTLTLLEDESRKDRFERQLTTEGYQSIQCVMGADAPLTVEDGRYATSIAQAPPACGTAISGAFVLDIQTGKVAAQVDESSGGDDLQERQYGDAALVTWLQGRYADGE